MELFPMFSSLSSRVLAFMCRSLTCFELMLVYSWLFTINVSFTFSSIKFHSFILATFLSPKELWKSTLSDIMLILLFKEFVCHFKFLSACPVCPQLNTVYKSNIKVLPPSCHWPIMCKCIFSMFLHKFNN